LGSTSIFLFEAGQAAMVIGRDGPDQLLGNPIWTSDGRGLIYDVTTGAARGYSIEQATLDGSARRTLERDAGMPALSPDGSLLAFVRLGDPDALVVRPMAGGGGRAVVPADEFFGISHPRFSPDGRRIAFLGIGGPIEPIPTPPINPLSRLRPGATDADAHGIPWDPWVVNLDGSGLRRVAGFSGDDPTVAWSPDGSSLAILGGDGLWLVPADGGGDPLLIGPGSYGGLDWRP
jgi:Tol biopolymer transport system component